MHELSICSAIASTAAKHAEGRPVTQVTVQIGHLRQVVPDALQFSWEVVSSTTQLKDAELVIEQVPAVVECIECGALHDSRPADPRLWDLRGIRREAAQRRGAARRIDRSGGRVAMGRFHMHADGTGHIHEHDLEHHDHDHDDEGRDVGDHSGYAETGQTRVTILENLLSENDRVADDNGRRLAEAGVRAVNLMSSPGAGKTTLLRKTLERLGGSVRIGVLEGDIATSLDADRLDGAGAVAISVVNTSAGFGGECHLDAVMVQSGIERLPLPELDLLIIENVGNLVCPAEFRVGEHARAMVFSVTEGEEKPLKYPVMFRAADVVVVNKIDLLPHLDFDLDAFLANLTAINPTAHIIMASARSGEGVDEWCGWLAGRGPLAATGSDLRSAPQEP